MTTVRITEGNQLVFAGRIADAPKTPFIADLIRDALRSSDGMTERDDDEGCTVTCIVHTKEIEQVATEIAERLRAEYDAIADKHGQDGLLLWTPHTDSERKE